FFSSRRRHTRFSRDWSSDVCSSDLTAPTILINLSYILFYGIFQMTMIQLHYTSKLKLSGQAFHLSISIALMPLMQKQNLFIKIRSEERRVGKECRTRW